MDDAQAFGTHVKVELGEQHVTPSLCMQCGAKGVTKLLFINIPKFHECIVSSFRCKHCGFQGRDVQQAADIQDLGVEVRLSVRKQHDLSRGLIKSATASVSVPELGLEQEARPMSGLYTTVEGFLRQTMTNLAALQPERRAKTPDVASKIDDVILGLQNVLNLSDDKDDVVCTIVIRDPSGNSYIEPFYGGEEGTIDTDLKTVHFKRTIQEAATLGLTEDQEKLIQRHAGGSGLSVVDERKLEDVTLLLDNAPEDMPVMALPTRCPACETEILNKSLLINIPYFKECLLMCSACDSCGFKSIEVKSAGAISPFGSRTTLRVTDPSDLSRDVLKSDSCTLEIPELGLKLEAGTLGGVYTTLEGLLRMLYDELKRHSIFWLGDGSASEEQHTRWTTLLSDLQEMCEGGRRCTVIIDDPLDASFIKNVFAPDPDPNLLVEQYTRTKEQDDEYGLNDMDTERFEKDC